MFFGCTILYNFSQMTNINCQFSGGNLGEVQPHRSSWLAYYIWNKTLCFLFWRRVTEKLLFLHYAHRCMRTDSHTKKYVSLNLLYTKVVGLLKSKTPTRKLIRTDREIQTKIERKWVFLYWKQVINISEVRENYTR